MMGLLEFLQISKSKLADVDGYEAVHAVIGNEACDLDSAVSAIVYAYVLSNKTSPDQKILHVPVLNIPKIDYSLKTDVTYALDLYDISAQDLTFRDEIDLGDLLSDKKLKLTLVDFNVFPERDESLEDVVVEVLDHHKWDRREKEGVDVEIEMVGSCCTLVAERAFKNLDEDVISKEALWLLYGTILLDTVCLSESAGRTTAKDTTMIEALELRLPNPSRTAAFDKLQAAKFDVSSLSTTDILRKDLKTISSDKHVTVAMSSIPLDMKEFLDRKDLLSALSSFTTQQGAAAVVIMALYVDQQREPHRQIAVYSTNPVILDQISAALTSAASKLDLSPLSPSACSVDKTRLAVYSQGNAKASRKVVLPIVKTSLQNGPVQRPSDEL